MHAVIRCTRTDVLLREHFQSIRDKLKKSCRPDPVGTQTILHPAQPFAFQNCRDPKEQREEKQDGSDRQQNGSPRLRNRRKEADNPMLQTNESLIDSFHQAAGEVGAPGVAPAAAAAFFASAAALAFSTSALAFASAFAFSSARRRSSS